MGSIISTDSVQATGSEKEQGFTAEGQSVGDLHTAVQQPSVLSATEDENVESSSEAVATARQGGVVDQGQCEALGPHCESFASALKYVLARPWEVETEGLPSP